jgi:hypothetical protein
MAVRNLSLSACEVGRALGVCETAATRKVADVESFISDLLAVRVAASKSGRPDRVRTAVVCQVKTLSALVANHPEQLEPWVDRLMEEVRS